MVIDEVMVHAATLSGSMTNILDRAMFVPTMEKDMFLLVCPIAKGRIEECQKAMKFLNNEMFKILKEMEAEECKSKTSA